MSFFLFIWHFIWQSEGSTKSRWQKSYNSCCQRAAIYLSQMSVGEQSKWALGILVVFRYVYCQLLDFEININHLLFPKYPKLFSKRIHVVWILNKFSLKFIHAPLLVVLASVYVNICGWWGTVCGSPRSHFWVVLDGKAMFTLKMFLKLKKITTLAPQIAVVAGQSLIVQKPLLGCAKIYDRIPWHSPQNELWKYLSSASVMPEPNRGCGLWHVMGVAFESISDFPGASRLVLSVALK